MLTIHTGTPRRLAALAVAALLPLGAAACMGAGGAGLNPAMASNDVAAHAFASAADMGEVEAGMLAMQRASNPQVRTFATMMVNTHSNALQAREARMAQLGMGMEAGMRTQGITASGSSSGSMGMSGSGSMGASGSGGMSGQGMQGEGGMAMGTGGMAMSMESMARMRGMLMQHPASRPLMEQNMAAMQMLSQQSGAAFDRAYLDQQVTAHQTVLQGIDRMITSPGAMPSPEVLGMLQAMRASVAGHLQTAQRLRASM